MALALNKDFLARIRHAKASVKADVTKVLKNALELEVPRILVPWNQPGLHAKDYGAYTVTWATTGLTQATIRALIAGELPSFSAEAQRASPTLIVNNESGGITDLGRSTVNVTPRSINRVAPRVLSKTVVGRLALTTEQAKYIRTPGIKPLLDSHARRAIRTVKRDLKRVLAAYWR